MAMKGKCVLLGAVLCLLLAGCGWFEGSYVSITPHEEQPDSAQNEAVSAQNYAQLLEVLDEMVESGTESGVINVADYDEALVERNMALAVTYLKNVHPIVAYAVEEIHYEVGTNTGRPAIAVSITYRHGRIEIQKIQKVRTMEDVEAAIGEALEAYDASLVCQVDDFEEADFSQIVQDYAEEHPDTVMEVPTAAAAIYGGSTARVVELTFTYQTSRDALRSMQSQVQPVFDSAVLYVSGEGADNQKYAQLYAFLMERFDYKLETSITPAYSLLRHGVGDSRAFATVYAAMCRGAGLECRIVTGTCNGEPWTWNIVLDNGRYYHVDLLRCSEAGTFRERVDSEMTGYVWDYSAYPECTAPNVPPTEAPVETFPPETATEQTDPSAPEESTEDPE